MNLCFQCKGQPFLKRYIPSSPSSSQSLEYLAVGKSGIVHAIDKCKVVKAYIEPSDNEDVIERQVYERLGSHKCIARYYGNLKDGSIILERGQVLRQHLRHVYHRIGADSIPLYRKVCWLKQVAEGLRHMHEKEIVHADIGCHNVIMVKSGNLKIIDFEGCSIDGGAANSIYEWFSYKRSIPAVSKQTDIFAYGCMIYEIIMGKYPHHELEKVEGRTRRVEQLYENNQYPDVMDAPLGDLMQACWYGTVNSMNEVIISLKAIKFLRWKGHVEAATKKILRGT